MLLVVPFFLLQTLPKDEAVERFLAGSNAAIVGISEGQCQFSEEREGHRSLTRFRWQKKGFRIESALDGNVLTEQSLDDASRIGLDVDHDARTVRRQVLSDENPDFSFGAASRSLEKGDLQFSLDSRRGLIVRSDPPLAQGKAFRRGDVEVLSAVLVRPDGSKAAFELERDPKTLLPRRMALHAPSGDHACTITFERRPVSMTELTIPLGSYAGYVLDAGSLRDRKAESFVAECAQAILKIEEGTWTSEMSDASGGKNRNVTTLKGQVRRVKFEVEGRLYLDAQYTPTSDLLVVPDKRQYTQRFFDYLDRRKPVPEPPTAINNLNVNLDLPQGFTIEASPELTDVRIEALGDVEILGATWLRTDGKKWTLRLIRDKATRLPTLLGLHNGIGEVVTKYAFEARKVSDAELWIEPETYEGFQKTGS